MCVRVLKTTSMSSRRANSRHALSALHEDERGRRVGVHAGDGGALLEEVDLRGPQLEHGVALQHMLQQLRHTEMVTLWVVFVTAVERIGDVAGAAPQPVYVDRSVSSGMRQYIGGASPKGTPSIARIPSPYCPEHQGACLAPIAQRRRPL